MRMSFFLSLLSDSNIANKLIISDMPIAIFCAKIRIFHRAVRWQIKVENLVHSLNKCHIEAKLDKQSFLLRFWRENLCKLGTWGTQL